MNTRWISSLVLSSVLLAFGCEQEPKASTNQTSASSTKATTPEAPNEPDTQTSTKPKVHAPLTKRGILEQKLSDLKTSEERHELLTGHGWVISFEDNEHETYVKLHDGSEIDITHPNRGGVPLMK